MNITTNGDDFSDSDTWATFCLAGEMFALPVEDVQEVLMDQPLTPVPLAPEHIRGLLNLRGQIMPAIDLRRRLEFPPRSDGRSGSILVVKTSTQLISVLVDQIGDVMRLAREDWRPAPDTLPAQHRAFVIGICPIQGHLVLGLRVDVLESADDDHNLKGAAQ
jgi:purine-binding chemotaxis protein CheW